MKSHRKKLIITTIGWFYSVLKLKLNSKFQFIILKSTNGGRFNVLFSIFKGPTMIILNWEFFSVSFIREL